MADVMPKAVQSPDGISLEEAPLSLLAGRSVVGGILMGLANLVPGISGGTMLLAAGIYPNFIEGIADISRLRFRKQSLAVLVTVACCAALSIVVFAGTIKGLVVEYRWVTYSLFIGLTLGGIPVVRGLIDEVDHRVKAGAAFGFVAMTALALLQMRGVATVGGADAGLLWFFLAGMAGASAMILPGVSGGYLLLVLGMYVPILSGIDAFKEALKAKDLALMMDPALSVVLPVGVGVVLGVVVVSNLLKMLLERFPRYTLGSLLGLLVGAVVGLWPFQQGVEPPLGAIVKGRVVTEEFLTHLDLEDWPVAYFTPTVGQVVASLLLIGIGFLVTMAVAWFGGKKPASVQQG